MSRTKNKGGQGRPRKEQKYICRCSYCLNGKLHGTCKRIYTADEKIKENQR